MAIGSAHDVYAGSSRGRRAADEHVLVPPIDLTSQHLARLGVQHTFDRHGEADDLTGRFRLRARDLDLVCAIDWLPTGSSAETVVQALSGLMAVHGRESGVPRRLGLNVATVATG